MGVYKGKKIGKRKKALDCIRVQVLELCTVQRSDTNVILGLRGYKHTTPCHAGMCTCAHTHTQKHTLVVLVLVAHCQNRSRGSPRERGERLKRNLGKMTQLAIEPPNGRHPLKSPKLWVDLKMIPLMGSPHLSKWVRTRCRKRIDGIRVSVLGSNCSYPCPQ